MEHIKAVRSQKRCKIGLWSQWPTNRKSDTHFRLVPKSSTLDDLERLRRTLVQKRCVFWSTLHKFKWRYRVDPYSQPQKCRPITIVSGNIRCMRIFPGVTLGGGPQVRVELSTTAIFGDLSGYFFGNSRDKASSIRWRYATPCRPVIAKWVT